MNSLAALIEESLLAGLRVLIGGAGKIFVRFGRPCRQVRPFARDFSDRRAKFLWHLPCFAIASLMQEKVDVSPPAAAPSKRSDGCYFCGRGESGQWHYEASFGGVVCHECYGRVMKPPPTTQVANPLG